MVCLWMNVICVGIWKDGFHFWKVHKLALPAKGKRMCRDDGLGGGSENGIYETQTRTPSFN